MVRRDAAGTGSNDSHTTVVLTPHAFEERHLEKLAAMLYEHNPASMRALGKTGWFEEAVIEREAFVDGEWVAPNRFAARADAREPASDRGRTALRS